MANRRCRHEGCNVKGGSLYMDRHEAQPHGLCRCGWRGAVRSHVWHVSQRVRYSAHPKLERTLHYLLTDSGEAVR